MVSLTIFLFGLFFHIFTYRIYGILLDAIHTLFVLSDVPLACSATANVSKDDFLKKL